MAGMGALCAIAIRSSILTAGTDSDEFNSSAGGANEELKVASIGGRYPTDRPRAFHDHSIRKRAVAGTPAQATELLNSAASRCTHR